MGGPTKKGAERGRSLSKQRKAGRLTVLDRSQVVGSLPDSRTMWQNGRCSFGWWKGM